MKKAEEQKGFTLVEMLIVVAIIAILVAVSIPMVSAALEKARIGVDEANERDAVGLAAVWYLTATQAERNSASNVGDHLYELVYWIDPDSHQGILKEGKMDAPWLKYGLSTAPRGDNNASPKGKCIMITMDFDGNVKKLEWIDSKEWG